MCRRARHFFFPGFFSRYAGECKNELTKSVVEFAESKVEPDESVVESDEWIVESDSTVVESDESKNQSDESKVESDESKVESDESRSGADESGAPKERGAGGINPLRTLRLEEAPECHASAEDADFPDG